MGYSLVSLIAYFFAGSLKFFLNVLKTSTITKSHFGLGGFPSTHTSIASSVAWLISLKEGIDNPAFAISISLLIIVVIDALDLRNKLGLINFILRQEFPMNEEAKRLRKKTGHNLIEILGGLLVGGFSAFFVNSILIL